MKKILIIEDDKALLDTLKAAMEAENYHVLTAMDGKEGLLLANQEKLDLICLDLVLPSLGGFEICKKLREKDDKTPIVFLTGEKKEEIDKVLGLELGGDDYITKPFGTRELLARIKAILRRTIPDSKEIDEYRFGDVCVDFKKHTATKGKTECLLTAKEIGLMRLFCSHEGEVLERDTILNKVWGYETFPTTRTIDTFIHNLRQKIEDDPSRPQHIITVPWSGYKFIK